VKTEGGHPPRWAGAGPWFVIVGGQRARSSLVHKAIGTHPGAYMPHRELAYFEDPNYRREPRSVFLDQFDKAPPGVVLGFKRPEILGRPKAPARLANAMPDARLVVLLREPVQRTVSAYFHYLRSAYLPMRPLNEGLRALLGGETHRRYPHSAEVLDFSHYGESLDRLFASFDPEQVVILLDRDLDADPEGSVRRILEHIGLDPSVPLDLTSEVVNAGDYASGLEMRILRTASRLVYRPERESGLTWARMSWPRVAAFKTLAHVAELVPSSPPPDIARLEPDVRAALADRFDPDVRRLEEILQRDLPGWPAR
jgi:hypothetical protein